MGRLELDVHGVTARLTGDDEALDELAVHFWAYRANGRDRPQVELTLERGPPVLDLPRRTLADQVLDRGIVYNHGATTWVDHYGRASTRFDFDSERGVVRSEDVRDLVELGYLALHSRLGRLLEARGLFRLHCLGVAVASRAALVLAPSGGGKSTLALATLRHTDARLLGDDFVLVGRAGCVLPFHSPLGIPNAEAAAGLGKARPFRRRLHPPKHLLELASIRDRLETEPAQVVRIVLARRVSEPPNALRPVARSTIAAALWRDLVVGLGLPQVLELVARRGGRDLPALGPTAVRRGRAAAGLLRASGRLLEVSDPASAAALIVREIEAS